MKQIFAVVVIAISAFLVAAGFNFMLIPHQLLSGGISGVSMIIGYFTNWNIGYLYLLLNLPVIVWGLLVIGRRYIVLSVISVILTSWFLQLVQPASITKDPLLGAVFGGLLVGLGSGMSLRAGGSTGGFDIIGSILTRRFDFPIGSVILLLNGAVILFLGYYKNNWDLALFSMVSIFVSVKIMDTVYIQHIKVTVFIVTQQKDKLLQKLLKLPRGVTVIKAQGSFSGKEQDLLMTVTTRYELMELKKIIKETDPKAFVNITETVGVMGLFNKN